LIIVPDECQGLLLSQYIIFNSLFVSSLSLAFDCFLRWLFGTTIILYLVSGGAGQYRLERTASNLLLSRTVSDRPPSVYECQDGLRRLLTAQERNEILSKVVEDPKKHHLLRAAVLAGCWNDCAGAIANAVANASEPRLVARDKVEECELWEESLTPPMKAARCGNLGAFKTSVSDSPDFMNETDSMGNGVWFWALTGGSKEIIDELPLQGLVSDVCYLNHI